MIQTGSEQSGIETGHVSMFRRIGITPLAELMFSLGHSTKTRASFFSSKEPTQLLRFALPI
jgi:hypothetical protein